MHEGWGEHREGDGSGGCLSSQTKRVRLFFDQGASLVTQLVKNLSEMEETWVRSLGWEDPLGKGKSTHSSILGLPLWLSW